MLTSGLWKCGFFGNTASKWSTGRYVRTREMAFCIVFRRKYIPQKWLSAQWAGIHKSPIVDIRSLHETRKGLQGIVWYLVGNYLAKQSFERMSWGYSWVFPAFVGCWKRLIEKYGFKQALYLWRRLLCSSFVVTRQVRLTRFLPEYEQTSEKSLP
jgi:hypothetical protein